MKLKAAQSLPSIKLAGRVPGDLHADLIAYAEYYREVLGRTNRSLAARGSDAPGLHTLRSRLSGVASSAPLQRGGPCRRDSEGWAVDRAAASTILRQ
jgi:hypothetical protein